MNCPICNNILSGKLDEVILCPSGHGMLITGSYLSGIEDAAHIEEVPGNSTGNADNEVRCPKCSNVMHKVNYNHTGIMIDSCINCHYRWLDSGEHRKIKDHKPQLKPEDAALLLSLEKQIGSSMAPKEVNPSYRLNSRSAFRSPGNLGLTAIQAIYRGIRHSRFMMIVTVLILIITALLYYYVAWEFRKP